MNSFSDLGLAPQILRALANENHTSPTPIQSQSIQSVLAGRDLMGIAQTGTGKTAAFTLPILHQLDRAPRKQVCPKTCRVLVLSPTRELAQQIHGRFVAYGRYLSLRCAIAVGGVPIGKQIRANAQGVDVLIATPGRLIDLTGIGAVNLAEVEVFVLDEADRMLDMGFIHPIRQIAAKLPPIRQTLFFSATMPRAIADLSKSFLSDPVSIAAATVAKTADKIDQHVIFVRPGGKLSELQQLLGGGSVKRALVFARTKRGADRIVRGLSRGGVASQAIHGDKTQPQRERALAGFRNGKTHVLVATDIAARGIDVADITHVINHDLPNEPESYVHRIGRTARAGAGGVAISLCTGEERKHLDAIQRLINQRIPEMEASGQTEHNWQPQTDRQRSFKRPAAGKPSRGVRRARNSRKKNTVPERLIA